MPHRTLHRCGSSGRENGRDDGNDGRRSGQRNPLVVEGIDAGVIDSVALDVAAWGSTRLAREIPMDGGSASQRRAVALGIIDHGSAGGSLRVSWVPTT